MKLRVYHLFGSTVVAALQLACLLLAAPAWAKERPELTLGIAGRHMGLMGVYEPLLTWTHFGRVLGCEYAVSKRIFDGRWRLDVGCR